jgi:hypothetical protein
LIRDERASVVPTARPFRYDRGVFRRANVLLAVVLAFACGPVPGGKLAGTEKPVPADWASTLPNGREICEVEARPAKPTSIQIECFAYEGHVYAQSHRWALASWWPVTSWAAVWIENPDVTVRLGDELFKVTAVRVSDAAQREPVLRFRGYDPVPEGIVLFRFEPRG